MIRNPLIAALAIAVPMGGAAAEPTVPIAGATYCGPRDHVVERLASKFKEQKTDIGMTSGGMLIELFQSEEGSWTLTISHPNGRTCLMAAGEYWERTEPVKPNGESS